MIKLCYSDGREVRNGDIVKYKESDPYYPEINEYEYCITIDENGDYSLESALGYLGDIDSVEEYELVERWEESELKYIIRKIEWLLKYHEQGVEFDFYLRSQLKILQQIFENIK